uniref:Holin n=1 Tax=Micrococcus phage Kurnik TaxID=3092208 RepID=A0AAU6R6C7_9CAUD
MTGDDFGLIGAFLLVGFLFGVAMELGKIAVREIEKRLRRNRR